MVYFAHSFEIDSYQYNRLPQFHHFEISYTEKGAPVRKAAEGVCTIPEQSVQIIVPGDAFTQFCSVPHRHLTFGFVCDCDISAITEAEILQRRSSAQTSARRLSDQLPQCLEAILPELLLPGEDTGKILGLIKRIIQEYHVADAASNLLACAGPILSVLFMLTDICCRQVSAQTGTRQNPGNLMYTKKAMQFIAAHIDEKLSVEQIAEAVGLSPGYLSNIFKSVTGQTLVYYINRMKVHKVMELLRLHDMTLQQAGDMVGIEDAHYLSRLFRKYYGMSFRAYRADYKKYGAES